MRLNPKNFNRMLNGIGQTFVWRRGYACPCVNKDSGQPKHNCSNCKGRGRTWVEGVTGAAGVVSQGKLRNYSAFGVWDKDDMLLSIPSDSPIYRIGQFDRVEAKNRTEPFSINFVRGLNDRVRFETAGLDRCFWLDGNEQVREAVIPTVGLGGALSWAGTAPPSGATFSLSGRRYPEYFCYLEIPTDRPMHHGAALPRRVVLRRFDLFGRS